MNGQEGHKKRKAASLKRDDDDDVDEDDDEHPDKILSIKVEHEDGENASLVVPQDVSLTFRRFARFFLLACGATTAKWSKRRWKNWGICVRYIMNDDTALANHDAVHKAGGAFAIVGAMRKWYNNPDIQFQGCRALARAAECMKSFCLASKEAGALEVVVSAMKNYPENRLVQTYGFQTCGNLCLYKENANHFVIKTNGLDLILETMREFYDNVEVQRDACMY